MITPSKFTSIDNSITGKMNHLLLEGIDEISVSDLRKLKVKKFTDVAEFILALDTLFILGKIELNEEKRTVRYVG